MDAIRFHLMWMSLVIMVCVLYCGQRLLAASMNAAIYNKPFDTMRVDAIPLLTKDGGASTSKPLVMPMANSTALQTSMSVLMLVLSIWAMLLLLTLHTMKNSQTPMPTSFTDLKTLFAMNVTRLTSLRGLGLMLEEMLDAMKVKSVAVAIGGNRRSIATSPPTSPPSGGGKTCVDAYTCGHPPLGDLWWHGVFPGNGAPQRRDAAGARWIHYQRRPTLDATGHAIKEFQRTIDPSSRAILLSGAVHLPPNATMGAEVGLAVTTKASGFISTTKAVFSSATSGDDAGLGPGLGKTGDPPFLFWKPTAEPRGAVIKFETDNIELYNIPAANRATDDIKADPQLRRDAEQAAGANPDLKAALDEPTIAELPVVDVRGENEKLGKPEGIGKGIITVVNPALLPINSDGSPGYIPRAPYALTRV